ncbi:MAG: hypothetical protein MHMPM18_003673 [Marteilia pararefringens]
MKPKYNAKNFSVKRLLREFEEVNLSEDIIVNLVDDNIFDWHFTFEGLDDTAFQEGIYHGRIIFPSNYPLSPPDIIFFNKNGKFEVNTKICLSNTGYHPESWRPSWNARTTLIGLRSMFDIDISGSLGSMKCSDDVRKQMAKDSNAFECNKCGPIRKLWIERKTRKNEEQKEITNENIPDPNININDAEIVESNPKTKQIFVLAFLCIVFITAVIYY